MLKTIIKINGQYYVGESDRYYNSGFKGVGWHDYKNNELNVLEFSDQPELARLIEGNTNLKSVLDKVLQRVRDGFIELNTIEIIKVTS